MLLIIRIITILVLVTATVLALEVRSIYALMINCWASQLVIVFLPVVSAIYCPRATSRSAWAAMGTATVVWIGYMISVALGIHGGFTEIMGSDQFQFALTNGAVYGFAAGTLAFLISYAFDLADHRSEETKTIATQN